MTIWECVARHGGSAKARGAIVVDRQRRTYGELTDGVRATAGLLIFSGVARQRPARLGILMAPGAAFFEAFLAAGAAGMAAMVLQRDWSDRELGHALAVGAPALIVADDGLCDRVRGHLPPGCAALPVGGAGVAAALRGWHGDPPAVDTARPATAVDDASPFYIGFTSGTTGTPKGFVRDHRSWLRSFAASEQEFAITGADHVLAPGPLDHSLFLYAAVHGLAVGATVHLHRRFAPGTVLDTLTREPISRVYVVPTMLASLLRTARRRGRPRFDTVTSVICAGARWPARITGQIADLFPNAEPVDFYGASELSFVSLRRPRAGDPPGCVGRPFPGVEIAVRRDDGSPCEIGEHGRLWVRSDMVFSGYLEPAEGGALRDADGWVTVGDVARRDARGRLHLVGREGGMLVCGGVNVFPEEIEDVLLRLPEVAEVAVTGIPNDHWGDQLCAVVRWRDGRALPRRRLREHCRAHLARDKHPQRWLQVADFPRTAGGKIARATLAQRLRDGTMAAEAFR